MLVGPSNNSVSEPRKLVAAFHLCRDPFPESGSQGAGARRVKPDVALRLVEQEGVAPTSRSENEVINVRQRPDVHRLPGRDFTLEHEEVHGSLRTMLDPQSMQPPH